MSDKATAPQFPKAHQDKMDAHAKAFNPSSLGTDARWRFDNMDAAEGYFTARQLEYMRPGIIEVKYPELKGAQLIPVNVGGNNGDATYTATVMDRVGQAQVASDMRGDIPRVDVKTTQVTTKYFSILLSYGYSVQEARAAMAANMPLLPSKAMACRLGVETTFDDILFMGNTVTASLGLLTQSSAGSYTTLAGAAGTKTMETKTPDEMLLTLTGSSSKIVTDSMGAFIPNQMVLPYTTWEFCNNKRVGDGTSMNVLPYFIANNPHVKNVDFSQKGESANATKGGWTGKRGVVYKKDPASLEAPVSQPFEQFAPQQDGLDIVTICHLRSAGVILLQPPSMLYFDQI